MFVCCEYCVLSGRSLCDELIARREESCRLWCVVVYDMATSRMRRLWPALGHSAANKSVRYYLSVCLSVPSHLSISELLNVFTSNVAFISTFQVLSEFRCGYSGLLERDAV